MITAEARNFTACYIGRDDQVVFEAITTTESRTVISEAIVRI